MLKRTLLLLVVVGMTLLLSGCGHWGCWDGTGHNSSHNNHPHAHSQDCGHSGY